MITPEPPAGSEDYREGWRHGYEQAAIDRERSADAVRPVTGQAPESPTDSTPKTGRGGSGEAETTTDTVQTPDAAARCSCTATHCLVSCVICGRVSYDGDCPNEAVSDREAVLERERLVQQKVLEQYERKIEMLQAFAIEIGRTLDRTAVALSESQSALRKATKAAQSGDTDRLAWISEAGETAAAERQARYQETACARRPVATTGDPAPADLAYARSEVDKWLADGDPYCILPTRTEHIPALLARLDELEGTS